VGAGQVVKFREFGNFGLTVNGTLSAEGTEAKPIIFTTTRDATVGGTTYRNGSTDAFAGQWDTIRFTSTSTASVLDHVEVRYGGQGGAGEAVAEGAARTPPNSPLPGPARAGIRIQAATPTLTNVVYQGNDVAASMDLASNPAISGVTLTANNTNALRVDGG